MAADRVAFSFTIVLVVGLIVGSQGAEARAGMYYGMQWNGAIFALLGPTDRLRIHLDGASTSRSRLGWA